MLSDVSGIEMAQIKQNKEKLNASVSYWIKKKALEYGESEEYGSLSNFVEIALAYYLGSLNKEMELKQKAADDQAKQKSIEDKNAATLLMKLLLKHPELIQELNESEPKNETSSGKRHIHEITHIID